MGYYIDSDSEGNNIGTSFSEKVASLEVDGATLIEEPTEFKEDLVVVVDNGMFAAAGYVFSEKEMNAFLEIGDRIKQWFIYKHAKELSGYK